MSHALTLCALLPLLTIACDTSKSERVAELAEPGQGGEPAPLFHFGLFADTQYADKPTKGTRTYRQALPLLEACAADLATRDLAFIAQLGDLIDGRETPALSRIDLERALGTLESTGHKLLHVIGNHCLTVPRADLQQRLGLAQSWYAHREPGWRFLVLDSMAFSLQSAAAEEAATWLAANPDSPNARTWNGGFGPAQLHWLAAELQAAEAAGESVAIFAHHPIDAASSTPAHLAWDHAEAHALITASPATVAYFSGHDHAGGYTQSNGVHFLTLPAMLESTAAPNAYAIVEAWPGRLVLGGIGEVQNRELRRGSENPAPSPL